MTEVILAYDEKNAAALNARIKAMKYLRLHTQNQVESSWLDYGIRLSKKKARECALSGGKNLGYTRGLPALSP